MFLAGTASVKTAQNESDLATLETVINSSSGQRLSQQEESNLHSFMVASPRNRLLLLTMAIINTSIYSI